MRARCSFYVSAPTPVGLVFLKLYTQQCQHCYSTVHPLWYFGKFSAGPLGWVDRCSRWNLPGDETFGRKNLRKILSRFARINRMGFKAWWNTFRSPSVSTERANACSTQSIVMRSLPSSTLLLLNERHTFRWFYFLSTCFYRFRSFDQWLKCWDDTDIFHRLLLTNGRVGQCLPLSQSKIEKRDRQTDNRVVFSSPHRHRHRHRHRQPSEPD